MNKTKLKPASAAKCRQAAALIKSTPERIDVAARAVSKALAPLIKLRAENKGAGITMKVADKLEALTGEPSHRQMVAAWLHPNENERIQPRFGTGLLLLKIQSELCK